MNTKKLTGLTLAGLLFLSGCQAGKTAGGKSVVASTSQGNIFADSIYSTLSNTSSGKTALFSYVLDTLISKKYPATNAMKKNAADMVENIKASYKSQKGDDYEKKLNSDLKSAGYKSIDDYRKKVIYSYQYAELMKKYVKDHFDEVVEDYYNYASPRKLSIIKVSAINTSNPTKIEKANLKEVQDLLAAGKSFADVAKGYSADTTKNAKGNLGIVDKKVSSLSDTYGSAVYDAAFTLTEGKTSSVITGKGGFYLLHCDSTKKEDIKKELKTVDINSPLITYDNYMVYLAFKTYKINYKDNTIKAAIEETITKNLNKRKEERK
ncbi:peptidylprolyl isomerase [Eggerthia catenaformis]|uniref:peptidylprolyl isomerase n=1 Tax=Eggerthia catenaformis TaxID=31973 RepID=UPI0028EBDADD|nr:peptidylprolyl isomerase [Eggerthia catenaformis]